jgi:hypothetical protein
MVIVPTMTVIITEMIRPVMEKVIIKGVREICGEERDVKKETIHRLYNAQGTLVQNAGVRIHKNSRQPQTIVHSRLWTIDC